MRTLRSSPQLIQCISSRSPPTNQYSQYGRLFHATAYVFNDESPTHYEVLQLPQDASPADIKRQFYALSKKSHPDLHPDDPTAGQRFTQLSEAYQTLSSPSLRNKYDRTLPSTRYSSSGGASRPEGSYSSYSAAGGRSPTGLSRRRAQFRGPPASWYAAWAATGQAPPPHGTPHTHAPPKEAPKTAQGDERTSYTTTDPLSPHFDRASHNKTHSTLRDRVEAREKEKRDQWAKEKMEREREQWLGLGMRFLGICAIVGCGAIVAGSFGGSSRTTSGKGRRGDV